MRFRARPFFAIISHATGGTGCHGKCWRKSGQSKLLVSLHSCDGQQTKTKDYHMNTALKRIEQTVKGIRERIAHLKASLHTVKDENEVWYIKGTLDGLGTALLLLGERE